MLIMNQKITKSFAATFCAVLRRSLPALLGLLAVLSNDAQVRADILYAGHNGSIVFFDTTANSPTPTTFATTGSANNYGLAFDSAGDLYVAHNNTGTIDRFTPAGVGSVFASGLPDVQGLAIDAADNLSAADPSHNRIEKFTPGGVASVFANTAPYGPTGLAFDKAGNLYASFQGPSDTIQKFTPAGVGSVFASTVAGPAGLAFDAAGNLYAAISGGTSSPFIEKFTPDGAGSVFATMGLSEPFGLAFDSSGNLYVANVGGTTIERFTPDGVGSTFVSDFGGPVFLAIRSAVPEPSSFVLVFIGSVAVLGYVGHRSCRRC
jgi:sugar lactone lactonase YvrE